MFRTIVFLSAVLLWTGMAIGQVNGEATVVSGYATSGVYPLPVVPLVNTPSMTLGATPVQTEPTTGNAEGNGTSNRSESFEFGAARSQSSFGAAELASRAHRNKAAKVYTNQDVSQVNDTNGLVKFGNKTEHL